MLQDIDAHGGGGGLLMNPLERLEKFGHKNAIKHENRRAA
jgi:hypothetical protein